MILIHFFPGLANLYELLPILNVIKIPVGIQQSVFNFYLIPTSVSSFYKIHEVVAVQCIDRDPALLLKSHTFESTGDYL